MPSDRSARNGLSPASRRSRCRTGRPALFLLGKHGARVITDGPDGSTVIVGSLVIDRILFQELTNHRLLAVNHLLPCEAVALDLGDGYSAKLAVFRCGQVAALLRNRVDHGSHRRVVLLLGILGECWR